MRVTPHDPKFNAVIGGPHSSFKFMAQGMGGVAMLFADLSRRLENFKVYGPPQIGKPMMSIEDLRFSKYHMRCGDESMRENTQDLHQYVNQMEDIQFPDEKVVDDKPD